MYFFAKENQYSTEQPAFEVFFVILHPVIENNGITFPFFVYVKKSTIEMNRSLPPVVKNILIINVILYLATLMLPTILRRWGVDMRLEDVLGMHYFGSEKFNLLQVVSYMFMHGSVTHILFNMFAVYMFGPIFEQVWGSRKFLFYYLVTGIGAGLVQQLFWYVELGDVFRAMNVAVSTGSAEGLAPFTDQLSHYFRFAGDITQLPVTEVLQMKKDLANALLTIGASGAVFGILLAFGWLFPEQKLFLIFFPVPIKARWFVAGYAVAELFLGVANFAGDSVAHFAHLGGMLFGVMLILYWKKKGKLYSSH